MSAVGGATVDDALTARGVECASPEVARVVRTGCRGRPRALTPEQVRRARALLDEVDEAGRPVHTYAEAAQLVGVARATLYRYLGARQATALASETCPPSPFRPSAAPTS